MFGPTVKRTIAQLRDAVLQQRKIGIYDPTPRELPFGSWVWSNHYLPGGAGETNVLGVILDVEKYREGGANNKGRMVRKYIVLTTQGQFTCYREQLMSATPEEVRKAEGLTADLDLRACVDEALKNGPSEANTLRFASAAKALQALGTSVVYFVKTPPPGERNCGNKNCSKCYIKVWTDSVPYVIRNGKW